LAKCLERIVAENGLTDRESLARYHDAWTTPPTGRRTAHRSNSNLRIS